MPFPQDNIRTTERAVEIGSLGGKVRSPKKKLAAKISAIRRCGKKLNKQESDKLLHFITDCDLTAVDMYEKILAIEPYMESEPGKLGALKLQLDLMKQVHGTKVNSKNININIEMQIKDFQDNMKKIFEDEE